MVELGIRYATAERFGPPQVCHERTGLGRFGPSCPQVADAFGAVIPGLEVGAVDEDCLYLNVWAPDGARDLPVMVWVPGGAFVTGGAATPTYDGGRLADHGVVVVTINYRLGALGFSGGNWGLMDILAALDWVQAQISHFGGDPAAVTVFGESAGAGAILHLLATPGIAGRVRRAILQSPGSSIIGPSAAARLDQAFRDALGTDPRSASVDRILDAQGAAAAAVGEALGPMPWHPVVDGHVVTGNPPGAIGSGSAAGVDLLIGATTEEMRLFSSPAMDHASPEEIADQVQGFLRVAAGMPLDRAATLALLAPYATLGGRDRFTAAATDYSLRAPALRVADAMAGSGGVTYAYAFGWRAPEWGACHAVDLPFTFGTIHAAGWDAFVGADRDTDGAADSAADHVAEEVMSSWAAFAATGDPSTPLVGRWPRYAPPERMTMVIGEGRDAYLASVAETTRRAMDVEVQVRT